MSDRRWQPGGRRLWSGAVAIALAGCQHQSPQSGPETPAAVVRTAARAVLIGRAYDRATRAINNENVPAMASAYAELQQLGAAQAAPLALRATMQNVVEATLWQAIRWDNGAQQLTGAARQRSQEHAAQLYRQALQLAPRFDSDDPQLLNALGYFLADRGSNQADFKEGERLARRALQLRAQEILQAEDQARRQPLLKAVGQTALLKFDRANIRDSLAWALYREGRYEAALQEQEAAVKEATETAPAAARDSLADLHFHLGEIYRALSRADEARREYQSALAVKPQHEGSQKALAALSAPAPRPPANPH